MDCFISKGQFYKELQENSQYQDFFSQTKAQGGGICFTLAISSLIMLLSGSILEARHSI